MLLCAQTHYRRSQHGPALEIKRLAGERLAFDRVHDHGLGLVVDVDTVSGEVRMALDARSSFGLRFTSHSGKLRDRGASSGGNDNWTEAVWGAGEGRIECETFSADAILAAR